MQNQWNLCLHWTAGSYTSLELDHYHYTVDHNGIVHAGMKPPKANAAPLKPGYVAHCGGGNTNCIGLSMAGMAGFKNARQVGKYPLTPKQCEATWKQAAILCLEYAIPVIPDRTFTHYEFGKKHPNTTSRGKIDIIHLPHEPHLTAAQVGDYIRRKISWYLARL
jgi:hypothetical protein